MTIVLLDGPMGTELVRRGVPTPAPAWSAHALEVAPLVVASIHRDYAVAGATVHTANTFRTTRRAVGQRWEALARRAVQVARDTVPAGQRVAGSIAPLEDCYRPDRSPGRAARPEHAELARALVDAGVDVLLCETFPDAVEAAVAVEGAARTGTETWVALTAGPGASLMTPKQMREAAHACVEEGARVVLVNCTPATQTLRYVEALAGVGVAFGAYANAGSVEDRVGWGADANEGAASYAACAGVARRGGDRPRRLLRDGARAHRGAGERACAWRVARGVLSKSMHASRRGLEFSRGGMRASRQVMQFSRRAVGAL
jgi:S-methylmethionine-dependent homocysteine/selenocysteine methylase